MRRITDHSVERRVPLGTDRDSVCVRAGQSTDVSPECGAQLCKLSLWFFIYFVWILPTGIYVPRELASSSSSSSISFQRTFTRESAYFGLTSFFVLYWTQKTADRARLSFCCRAHSGLPLVSFVLCETLSMEEKLAAARGNSFPTRPLVDAPYFYFFLLCVYSMLLLTITCLL